MTPPLSGITILEAIDTIWSPWFKRRSTWAAWRTFLAVLFGLPLNDDDTAFYRERTGRTQPPPVTGFLVAWLICGRRAGKSFTLALIAVYLALARDWSQHLSPGELGCVKVIATDRKQARTIYRYARALLTKVPQFNDLVLHDTGDELELTNGVVIEIQTASFRSVRSYTVIAALCDEIAYWRSEETAANPDSEILAAIRPAMATVPNAMLLCASSPYARRGELWNAYRKHYGRDDARELVWHADTRTMNPTVPQSLLDEAYEDDPAKAGAEYGAQFRSDVESFIPLEAIAIVTITGRRELPFVTGNLYFAFVDPSGGKSDSMTLAVAHRAKSGVVVLDAVREVRPPFSPEAIVREFASLISAYKISKVVGDRYAGEWVSEQFVKAGISYEVSERSKSELYLELLPIINSVQVELLDNARLAQQLTQLERRTARGGRDSVDHAPGAHDDIANSAAGAIVLAYHASRLVVTREMLALCRTYGSPVDARPPPARPDPVTWVNMTPQERMRHDFGAEERSDDVAAPRTRLAPSLAALARARQPGTWSDRADTFYLTGGLRRRAF